MPPQVDIAKISRRVLKKISKTLQESYGLETKVAQNQAISLERRVQKLLQKDTDLASWIKKYKVAVVDLVKKIETKQVDLIGLMTKHESASERRPTN